MADVACFAVTADVEDENFTVTDKAVTDDITALAVFFCG